MKIISLAERNALITGGSRGIGAQICNVFAECGANVGFTYKRNSKDAEKLARSIDSNLLKAIPIQADAGDEKQMHSAVEQMVDSFKKIDILVVNVAGAQSADINSLSYEDWKKGLDINLSSAYLAIKLAYPYLVQAPRGDILLIGSSAAYDGGGPTPYYAAAKAGMGGMVRHLMRQLSEYNIRINVIHPCLVDTDGLRKVHNTPEKLENRRSQIPLGRLSKPDDIANLAAFLCSDLCEFITGQSILVDGGRTLWKKNT